MHSSEFLKQFILSKKSKSSEKVSWGHRRRIETEEKAKVVASVWGEDFIQFLAAASRFALDDFEEYHEFILFFQIILVQFIQLFKIVYRQNS